ncbi:GLE1-like protein-domain-containing protein [Scheffersomyces xylosifermentans]|uniref:GLE1-like protein-domain-containing protein n=1 Tax=Scheffersomyces xylosifermentans TaxID=1304137 RepID=UPI00315D36F1
MRFGLPPDFELLVEVPLEKAVHPSVSSIITRDGISSPISPLSVISSFAQNPAGQESAANRFKQIRDSIDKYTDEKVWLQQRLDHQKFLELNNQIEHHAAFAESTVERLLEDFQRSLRIQDEEVQKIVQDEIERQRRLAELKRQQEEERKRQLEAEKARKEEELRRKREEEERRRKTEEERQRKLAEEKRLKQEQEEKERKEKEEIERAQKEKEEEEKRQLEQQNSMKAKAWTNFKTVETEFLGYKKAIVDIKENIVEALNADKELKKHVNQLKRKINPKFGQLSNSFQQLERIKQEVIELVNASKPNDLAYKWILNFIAKAVVDQAETEVIVKPTAALPLAHLAYTLLYTFPEFEYFLTARFVKKCPFIIGYTCAIDSEEGCSRMGWKRRDNKWEDDAKYDERVSGICTVWSTMTRLQDYPQLPMYSFEASWKFLSRLLNTDIKLITNAHFSLGGNWWEACARDFLSKYGRQSYKLLQALAFTWPAALSDRKYPAAARLLILGEDWLQNNNMNSLKEMER